MHAHPPTYHLHALGPQAQHMAKYCGSERMAMILQGVAVGSMIIMAGATATHLLKELFGPPEHHGKGRAT